MEWSVLSETKEETTSSLRARDVGASTTLGTFALTDGKGTRGRSCWWYTFTGSHLIREPLGSSGLKEGAFGG
jgi:hypothetical protein